MLMGCSSSWGVAMLLSSAWAMVLSDVAVLKPAAITKLI